jgi:acyl transferase domain-containing protein
LEARLGVKLPRDLLSLCPTPKDLISFILVTPLEVATSHIEKMETEEIKIFRGIQSSHGNRSTNMVPIVGMAATLPGRALRGGCITPVDGCRLIGEDRWDPDIFVHLTGDRAVRFAGIIDNVSWFDPEAFWIAEKEAILMDPQQRLVLETVAESMAQFSNKSSVDTCGTFVGCSSHDYLKMSLAVTGITAYTGTGTSSSVVSGRLSYTFGFQGPAMTIDTACSSSLVGMHMAFNCIDMGQCVTASGSGVNIILHPTTLATLQKAGMLTYDGRCKTLDATADGYVRAEAVGSLLLHAGEVNSSECLCFFMGSSVNQDGRSSALTAPNGPAQTGVVKSALHLSDLGPSEIDSLQMHGTGTSLGDPIEVGAANASFVGGKARELPLILMASKSWMGHAEPAAGIAGLTHAQVSTAAKCVMEITHLREMNPYVVSAIGSSHGMFAPRENLGVGSVSIIGTSAFAFQGTNAHVIMSGIDIMSVQTRPKYVGDNRSLLLRKKHLWLAPATAR